MSDFKLVAETRTDFGKGAARRTRRAGLIPAVLYGHGTDPLHVSLPGHQTFLALKHANALFEIEVEGTTHLAIVRDVQRDVVRQIIEHVDLLLVKKGEKVEVEVQVVVTGDSAPGTIHVTETQTLLLEALATNLPESITVDVSGLEAGAQIAAGDIELPEGATLIGAPEQVIVLVSQPRASAEDEVADAAAAEA